MICPLMKKDRCGSWICGGYRGRCQYPTDPRFQCEIRDRQNRPGNISSAPQKSKDR